MATVAKRKYKIIIHIFFILLCLLYVLPLWLVVSISFSSEASITANNSGYSLIPKDFSTEAYKLAFQNPQSMVSAYWITAAARPSSARCSAASWPAWWPIRSPARRSPTKSRSPS